MAVLADTYTRNETIPGLRLAPVVTGNALHRITTGLSEIATFKSGPFRNGADE
ncbi:hypothetical protein KCP70_14865 [Salmonella enterica subsp. enterica]|nr:hypothetical protein KCP70_14865 [Salmonella enterica subsp. enterica]